MEGDLTTMSRKDTITLKGVVVSGLGEGAKYVEKYKGVIKKYLGIDPYPGTLNIDIKRDLTDLLPYIQGILVPPPSNGYAPIIAYKARMFNDTVYVVKPCITRHGWNIIEVIARDNLRRKYGLKNGDLVEIVIYRRMD